MKTNGEPVGTAGK